MENIQNFHDVEFDHAMQKTAKKERKKTKYCHLSEGQSSLVLYHVKLLQKD